MYCENGKVCYETSKEASTAAANLHRHDRKHKYSFYKCNIGKHFHVATVKNKKMLVNKKKDKYPFKYTAPLKEEVKPKKTKGKWK